MLALRSWSGMLASFAMAGGLALTGPSRDVRADDPKPGRWVSQGRVTDRDGKGVPDAEVRVATGMGTLHGGGRTTSDAEGRFTLRFGEGIWSEGPNLQVAMYFVSKPGMVEASRSRSGSLWMAREIPPPGDWPEARREEIALPGVPFPIDFVMTKPAVLNVQLEGGPKLEALAIELLGGQDDWCASRAFAGPGEGVRSWEVAPGQPWRVWLRYRETRFRVNSPSFTLPGPEVYVARLAYRPDPVDGVDTLVFERFEGPDGSDVRTAVVGDDPMTRPALGVADQQRGREILRKMATVNAPWLGPAPAAVGPYSYRFRFAAEEEASTTYEVGDRPVPGVVRHGVSFVSVVHYLAEDPGRAVFRKVESGPERIELVYTLKAPVSVSAGNGVLGTWRGFFSMPAREGRLVLDTATFTPIEHATDGMVEHFGPYAVLDAENHRAPLEIRVDHDGMRFGWAFQVFKPGLWLLDSAYRDDGDEPVAIVDQVKVGGVAAERVASGRRPGP